MFSFFALYIRNKFLNSRYKRRRKPPSFRLHFPGKGGRRQLAAHACRWTRKCWSGCSLAATSLSLFSPGEKNQDAASLQQRCGSGRCLLGLSEPQQVHRAGNVMSGSSASFERLVRCLRTEPNRTSPPATGSILSPSARGRHLRSRHGSLHLSASTSGAWQSCDTFLSNQYLSSLPSKWSEPVSSRGF